MRSYEWLLTFLVLAFMGSAAQASGLYAVTTSSKLRAHSDLMNNPCVSGLTVYYGWKVLEPEPGRVDARSVEQLLRAAADAHKKVNLAVLPGRWSPQWLFEAGAKKMFWIHRDTYVEDGASRSSFAAIPWDPVYQRRFLILIETLAPLLNKYAKSINSVAITGGSNTNGLELNFIATDAELARIGFSVARYVQAWQSFIDAFATLENIRLTLAVHTQFGSTRRSDVNQAIINYAKEKLGRRLTLAALAYEPKPWFRPGNAYVDLVLSNPANGFVLQSIRSHVKSADRDGFLEMVAEARKLNPDWLEVWAEDVASGYLQCDK